MVISLIRELDREGYQTEVQILKTHFPSAGVLPDGCRIVSFIRASDLPVINFICKIIRLLKADSFAPFLDFLFFTVQSVVSGFRHRGANGINIGIDSNGSIVGLVHHILYRKKFIYLSLELAPPDGFRGFLRIIPCLEYHAFRRAAAFIIQDSERLAVIAGYHHHNPSHAFLIPNSCPAMQSESIKGTEENFLRKTLSISDREFPWIVLQAGMIADDFYARELAQSFSKIKGGFALVLHERIKRDSEEFYIQELRRINSRNLFLSLDPVPLDQVDWVFRSANIGLALYGKGDENWSLVAMASGKLAYYLKHGIPVLVNNLPSLKKLNDEYQFGCVIEDPSNHLEITMALEKIVNSYQKFSDGARRCYDEKLDFSKRAQPFLSFCKTLN